MNTIAAGWKNFETLILNPINPPDIQRWEMQKAFYAGAAQAISVLRSVSEDQISEEAGAMIIEGLVEEIQLFAKQCLQSNIPVQSFYWKE